MWHNGGEKEEKGLVKRDERKMLSKKKGAENFKKLQPTIYTKYPMTEDIHKKPKFKY
jgi:hypothetical protein